MSSQQYMIVLLMIVFVANAMALWAAHQDPCHWLHSCPSDGNRYIFIFGDQGRCDQCPDHDYCLAGKPRMTSIPTPDPFQPALLSSTITTPSTVAVRPTRLIGWVGSVLRL
jgi:hypothetical protein